MLAAIRRSATMAPVLSQRAWYRASFPAASKVAGSSPGEFPEAHRQEDLDPIQTHIGLKRLVDLRLRQDLSFQKARTWDEAEGDSFKSTNLDEYFTGKKVVIFGVPGAFTGVCTKGHVPSFVKEADSFKAAGVDTIACVSVNDPYCMNAWGKQMGLDESKVELLADVSGAWTRMLGLEMDLAGGALGHRSNRYSMYVVDGQLIHLNVEDAPGDLKVSDAPTILEQIKSK